MEDDEDTAEDLFMNNPSRTIIQAFYTVLPITAASNIDRVNYPYLFSSYNIIKSIFKYVFIWPICFLVSLIIGVILGLTSGICGYLTLVHKGSWGIYRYLLRQQYYIYSFIINMHTYSWYKLLALPLTNVTIWLLRRA